MRTFFVAFLFSVYVCAFSIFLFEFPSIQIKVFIRRDIELIKGALFIVFVTEQKKIYSLYWFGGRRGRVEGLSAQQDNNILYNTLT